MRDGAPAAARVEGRDEGAARHHHARRRQGQDLRRKAEGVMATPAQVKPELKISIFSSFQSKPYHFLLLGTAPLAL